MKRKIAIVVTLAFILTALSACGGEKKRESIVIYSCANEERVSLMQEALSNQFPDYDIVIEYMGTGKLSAKILAEGKATDADILHDLSYLNMDALNNEGLLADVSWIDRSPFLDEYNVSDNYVIECMTSGAVIVNMNVIESKGLDLPRSYEDLLKPEYKGLISMADPKASSTGYMFVKSIFGAYGDEKGLDYFRKLSENVLQFTSSGNGPVNALMQQEVAIGLGMTNNAVGQIDLGADHLKILFFEEGSPYAAYGQTIIAGKDNRACVKEVFEWMVNTYLLQEHESRGSEQVFKGKVFTSKNYPSVVKYSDMGNNTLDEKERILALWDIT